MKKIDPKRLEMLRYHTGNREGILEDALEGGFRIVRGCVGLKEDDGDILYYRGYEITVDRSLYGWGRYSAGSLSGRGWGAGDEKLAGIKVEIDRRIEEKEALKIAASRDIDQEIRSALVDNARSFGLRHRRDGVTLSATIDGTTYLVNTGSGCAEIEDIEQALAGHCTTSLMDQGDWRFIVCL